MSLLVGARDAGAVGALSGRTANDAIDSDGTAGASGTNCIGNAADASSPRDAGIGRGPRGDSTYIKALMMLQPRDEPRLAQEGSSSTLF